MRQQPSTQPELAKRSLIARLFNRVQYLLFGNLPAVRAANYDGWRRHFMHKRLRLGLVLAFCAFLTFMGLELYDWLFQPEAFIGSWFITQFVGELCLIVCYVLLRSQFGRRYPEVIFLLTSWSINLNAQVAGIVEGKMEPSLLIWPLMFLGQATLIPVRWRLHVASQLGLFGLCAVLTVIFQLDLTMPTVWMTPPVTFLYFFWLCATCDLSVYLYDRLQRSDFNSRRALESAYEQLSVEQERSERLLLNILPEPIAERLKQQDSTIADSFSDVAVLFGDIVGFTELSSRIEPPELVELLNQIFSEFDRLADLHGLEKIKTIGDSYMMVAGLPIPRDDYAAAIADMALDMQRTLQEFNQRTGQDFHIRIGIATGPVVAGVIGIKKFIYDLWGDTVNLASRMESHGIANRIQVTEATYECLKDKYFLEKRGAIAVKGKGEMTTYLLLMKRDPSHAAAPSLQIG